MNTPDISPEMLDKSENHLRRITNLLYMRAMVAWTYAVGEEFPVRNDPRKLIVIKEFDRSMEWFMFQMTTGYKPVPPVDANAVFFNELVVIKFREYLFEQGLIAVEESAKVYIDQLQARQQEELAANPQPDAMDGLVEDIIASFDELKAQ